MNTFPFEELPPLKTFGGLKKGDKVYTKSLGIGEIIQLYEYGEIIVGFPSCKKRLSPTDSEVWKVPPEMTEKRVKKPQAFIGEKEMTIKQFKREKRASKRVEKEIQRLDREAEKLGIKITRKKG